MNFLQNKKKQGFTLIELIVVIAIIAILITVALIRMGSSTLSAKVASHNETVRSLLSAARMKYAVQPKTFSPAIFVDDATNGLSGYFQGTIQKPIDASGQHQTDSFKFEISNTGEVTITPGFAQLNADGKTITVKANTNIP